MDEINQELDEMLQNGIVNANENPKTIDKINFGLIRDLFRQHVNNRRTSNEASLLMREDDIKNLRDLKEEIIKIMNQFGTLNSAHPASDQETFSSLNEFISNAMSQQESLRSEIWKFESFIEKVMSVAQEQEKLCSSMDLGNTN